MIFKYIAFLFTLLWSYTFIKSQSIFKKGSGILITLFVSNISWLTFIAACYYGFKNFELVKLKNAGEVVGTIYVNNGKALSVPVKVSKDVSVVISNHSNLNLT